MSEYCLNISGNIELGDYSSINNYMSLISDNDSLIIDINSKNQKDIDLICSLLNKKKFKIDSYKPQNDGICRIVAYKMANEEIK